MVYFAPVLLQRKEWHISFKLDRSAMLSGLLDIETTMSAVLSHEFLHSINSSVTEVPSFELSVPTTQTLSERIKCGFAPFKVY